MLFRPRKLAKFGWFAAGCLAAQAAPWNASAFAADGLTSATRAARCAVVIDEAIDEATEPVAEEELADGEALPANEELIEVDGDYRQVHKLAPNAIGDGLGGNVRASTNFGGVNGFLQGGYTFKAASNNNAIPQDRVYYSYQYLSASSQVDPAAGPPVDVDLQQHVFGFEKLLIGDIYALGVQIPVQYQLASELNLGVDPVAQDTEIGNMTVYSKHILYQSWRTTLSGGFALGLPTGDEFSVTIAGDNIRIENDAWTLTPYLATLFYDPCNCYYLQLFGQLDFSLDDNEVYVNGANAGNLQDVTLFRFDVSYGYWLSRDCCNNGIVAIAELHYATSLSGEDIVNAGAPTAPIDVTYDNNEQLNATFGVGVLHNCWSITPALSLPLLDSPNRSYDWEAQLLLQRRL